MKILNKYTGEKFVFFQTKKEVIVFLKEEGKTNYSYSINKDEIYDDVEMEEGTFDFLGFAHDYENID
jgi:hypothetical protein